MGAEILIGQNFTEMYEARYSKIGDTLTFSESVSKQTVNSIKQTSIGVDDPQGIQLVIDLLNKFPQCCAQNLSQIGVTSSVQMKITLTSEKPIAFHPRQLANTERIQVREMVDDGIIRESESPYASNIVLVTKKNGQKRLCVHHKALKRITVPDKYPLPPIEDLLQRLSGYKYFTSLDLFSEYAQH